MDWILAKKIKHIISLLPTFPFFSLNQLHQIINRVMNFLVCSCVGGCGREKLNFNLTRLQGVYTCYLRVRNVIDVMF
jgi:hypothetical protein